MPDVSNFAIDRARLRPGQRGAIDTILTRRRNSDRFTSVVLPTRYGKSDVIRLSALQMMQDRQVSNALIVVPALNLVDQMLDQHTLIGSAQRYGFGPEIFMPVQRITRPPRIRRLKMAKLSAVTTHMVNRHLAIFENWVDSMLNDATGSRLPPVVYMDEAHLGSDGNRWGNISNTLAEIGAYVVVLTATPFRQDGRPIPGFDIGQRQVVETTPDGQERVLYEINPHWETTLQEAMEENPPPIAQITYQPFGIAGALSTFGSMDSERAILDDLTDPAIRYAYREALRKPDIIKEALRFFLSELRNRRGDPIQAGTVGIIFVGNNEREFDKWENDHANRVKGILHELSRGLRCEVIVSSDPKAQELLDEFMGGSVDVAIVKQMGAIGLDVPHLKVALDLSNTRSLAYFLQRMMRIATRWEPQPEQPVLTGTYIAPDDRITRAAVNRALEGTGVLRTVLEGRRPDDGIVSFTPRDGGPGDQSPLGPTFEAEEVVLTGNLLDYDGTTAPATYIPAVDSFNARFAGVAGHVPKGALADWLRSVGVTPDMPVERLSNDDMSDSNGQSVQEDVNDNTPPPPTFDMTELLDGWREKVSEIGHKAINQRYKWIWGPNNYDGKQFGVEAGKFWSEHFMREGLPGRGYKLEYIDDTDTLQAIYRNIEHELRGGNYGGIR